MNFASVDMSPFIGWLVKTTLQGSVLILLIIAIKWLLRARLTARWQCALWLLLLVRLGAPWMPQSRLSLSGLIFELTPRSNSTTASINHISSDAAPNISESTAKLEQETGALLPKEQSPSVSSSNAESGTVPQLPAAPDVEPVQDPSLSTALTRLPVIWPWLWLTGAAGLGTYIGLRNLRLWLIVTAERQLVEQEVLELLEDCKQQMHVKTPVSVVVTDKLRSPALFGFVRPRILLPQGLLEMVSLDELQYVFMHELAHLKRGDIYVRWLTAILQILHWFNPLIWFGFRQMHADQETACDALAMSRMASEETPLYGHTLVRLLERFSQPQYLPSVAGILEDRSRLERRISMISQFKNSSYRWSPMAAALIIGLACIALPDAHQMTNGSTSPEAPAQPQVKLRLLREEYIGVGKRVLPTGHKRLSPDGLKMAYAGDDNGLIVVTDLSTGVKRKYEQSTFSVSPVWSPDGKRIAFLDTRDLEWLPDGRPDFSSNPFTGKTISILTLETGDLEKTDIQGLPCDWSRDGRFLLVLDPAFDQSSEGVQLVDLETGKTQAVIPAYKYTSNALPRLSPDGSYVVYNFHGDEQEKRHIYIQPTDLDEPIRITSTRDGGWNPLWSADGKHILFLSDREFGRWNLFSIGFESGKPVGEPEIVASDMMDGDVLLYSCSNSGSLLFTSADFRSEIFSTSIDPASGKVLEEPDRLTDSELMASWPTWSRDGRYIAYYETAESGGPLLCVADSDGRNKRTLGQVKAITGDGTNTWHPDNEHIFYPGREADPDKPGEILAGIYSISIRTGQRKLVYHDPEFRGGMHLSPDGKHLALISGDAKTPQLYIVDTDGKNRRQLATSDGAISKPIFTPDGREIIYTLFASGEGEKHRLSIMAVPIEGGESREVYASEDSKVLFDTYCSSWLPDGRYVFDIVSSLRQEDRAQYTINLDGKSDPVRISDRMGGGYCVSPDGTKAVYYLRESVSKLWLMSDFLPSDDAVEAASGDPNTESASASKTQVHIGDPKAALGLTLRKLLDGSSGFRLINARSVSRDGRYVLGPRGIFDLNTGEIRKIEGFEANQFTPDGRKVLGSRRWPGTDRAIVVLDLQSGETEEIYRDDDLEDIGLFMDCSSDGHNILTTFTKKDESRELVSISISDGTVRVLKTFPEGILTPPNDYRFSPDGRWVACGLKRTSEPSEDSSESQRDIDILAVDGSSEFPLVQHPANDQLLGWSPFGDRILFASNRSGTWDAYMIQVIDGKPVGEAELVKAAVSAWPPMYADTRTGLGFTESGSFYYLSRSDTTDVYVAELDPTTGKTRGNPFKATKIEDITCDTPAWSPDSRFLVYDTLRGKGPGSFSRLRIRDMQTGSTREIVADAGGVTYPKWSPDGQSILAIGWGESWHQAVRIDPESGESSVVVASDGTGWWQNWPGWNWSPDGKSFYRQSDRETLTRHDLDTGQSKEISIPRNLSMAVLSPDCEHFVYSTTTADANGVSRTINIRPTNGGAVRQLVKLTGAEAIKFWAERGYDKGLSWTPDSRYVLFVKGKPDNSKANSLWRIPAAGGEPEALGLEMPNLREPAISPDGRYIAFTTGGSKVELWSMENFLPKD